MGSTKKPASGKNSASASHERDVSGIHAQQLKELEDLTLFSQPFKTSKYFLLAVIQHFQRSISYILGHGGWVMLFSIGILLAGVLLVTIDGPHEKHVEEAREYVRFGLWWMALGVASSIGLGSGLHTFVLYLGPHIALFTIKAVQCGRVDIKAAPYDTIQLKRVPSWLGKECSVFLPALSPSSLDTHISLSSILPQVQLEAILWGIGTALGELPPYFISRAANSSGSKMDSIEELDDTSEEEDGFLASKLNKIKRWFLSHAQYMNFFTILVLASVPNPLFDLAGIMCGQFGIPFWEFFLATLIGKAIIKTHIQTVFIISVCNNQLLNWIENEFIWVLSFIPGFDSILPGLVAKLHSMKNKYLATKPPAPENVEVNKWDFSIGSIWNTVVWIMLLNFFIKIVNATAQGYLKKEHEERNKSSELVNSDSGYHQTQDAFVD